MKILHLQLTGPYTEKLTYQENYLTAQNKKAGHEVKIITMCEAYVDGKLQAVGREKYINSDGLEVVRLPYKKWLPHVIMRKIRAYQGLYDEIRAFKPDIILNHGLSMYDIKTVVRYKKNNPDVKLYMDSHAESQNTATTWVSKNILHKLIYRGFIKNAYEFIEKIFCLSPDCIRLAKELYKVPDEKIVYWPLGGEILPAAVKEKNKADTLNEYGLSEDKIIFCHSGKFDAEKRTAELIRAFSAAGDERFVLIIAGVFLDDAVKTECLNLIESDGRIRFVGWKNGTELLKLLCATDVYCQPGNVSATLQNSMCCGAAPMIFPHEIYTYFIPEDAAFYIKTESDMAELFKKISAGEVLTSSVKAKASRLAKDVLDYEKIAKMYIV